MGLWSVERMRIQVQALAVGAVLISAEYSIPGFLEDQRSVRRKKLLAYSRKA